MNMLIAPLALVITVIVSLGCHAQPQGASHEPPIQAYDDCRGHQAGAVVQHRTQDGVVAATCTESPGGLVARPQGGPGRTARPGANASQPRPADPSASSLQSGVMWPGPTSPAPQHYSLQQAISDQAQLHTIAFSGLAFITGDFGHDTFLPPGKVSDYFGFQYMRDIDAQGRGHNTSFLTRIAHNMLAILDDGQKLQLINLAQSQQDDIRRFALMRLPLIKAFRLNLEGGMRQQYLNRQAVEKASADLYALDGKLAYERARTMASVVRSLSPVQQAALARLKFGDSATWPELTEPMDRRRLSHEVHVAVMTYASEMFSWVAGSIEADTYFCPERHGMYFGGFGMKTAPAMGQRDYAISTSLTGHSGEAFLAALEEGQRRYITSLIETQKLDLDEIVRLRKAIASELRRFLRGDMADLSRVIALSRRYGELDGHLSYLYASAFARVAQSLTVQQRLALLALRQVDADSPKGPFLYSSPVDRLPVGAPENFFVSDH